MRVKLKINLIIKFKLFQLLKTNNSLILGQEKGNNEKDLEVLGVKYITHIKK